MARNVQVKPPVRHASRQYGGGQPIIRDSKSAQQLSKNENKFTLKQLVIFWSVTALMMLAVFVSGYKAGKEEGAREILDKSSRQMVRLPVAMPKRVKTDNANLDQNDEVGSSTVSQTDVSDPDEIAKQQRKIDFTKSESLPAKELPPVVDKTLEVKNGIVNVVTPVIPKVKKKEETYEEIYPGRRLFPPPGAAKTPEQEVVAPVVEGVVDQSTKPTPPPAPSVESLAPSPGWYVQVAAARSKEEAMQVSKKLSGKGIDSKVEEASTRTGTYFRILVGPYGDRGKALGDRTTIKSTAGISGEPFIREVK
jgi:cell division protein FtsN